MALRNNMVQVPTTGAVAGAVAGALPEKKREQVQQTSTGGVGAAAAQAVNKVTSGLNKVKTAAAKVVPAQNSGGGSGGGETAAPVIPNVTQQNIDNSAYSQALAAAQAARGGAPVYTGSFDDQIADLYAQINGRADFSYDLNGDAFWQQYKDKYTQAAKNAMRDTMGQAAALTGGYGSSYGQAVGQQAYDRRMEELLDIAPELYDRAYERYQDEGNQMLQQFDMARQMANDEYGRYVDDYSRWLTERDYADAQLEQAYQRQMDNRAFLQSMMALGYTPTAQEIADAGLNSGQYAALAAQFAPKPARGGGPDNSNEDSGKTPTAYEVGVAAANRLGAAATTDFDKLPGYDKLTEKEKRQVFQGISDRLGLAMLDK